MPANFRAGAADREYRLWWNTKEFGSIVFTEKPRHVNQKDEGDSEVLLMNSSRKNLFNLLVGMGFEEKAVSTWTNQLAFKPDDKQCLLVTSAAESCVDVWLTLENSHTGNIELMVAAQKENLTTGQPDNSKLALVGSTFFSLGRSVVNSSTSNSTENTSYLNLTTRGIASRGPATFEYDTSLSNQMGSSLGQISGSTSQSAQVINNNGNNSTNLIRYRLLAAGHRVEQGRAYAGLFTSASSDTSGGGNTAFLSHPSIMGFAYKSDGSALNSFGIRRKVRLLLNADSFVRILSNGSELYAGVVSAGDQLVDFSGYADGFVDVLVRDASGRVEQRQVEVISDLSSESEKLQAVGAARSNFYVDAGRVMDNSFQDNRNLKTVQLSQASVVYNYFGDTFAYQSAAQIIGDRKRVVGGISDRSYLWRFSAMKGNGGEYGLNAGALLPLPQEIFISSNVTQYQPPSGAQTPGAALGGVGTIYGGLPVNIPSTFNISCNAYGNALCFNNSSYTSLSAGISKKGFPLRLSYLGVRTPQFDTQQVTVSGSTDFRVNQSTLTLVGFANYDLKKKTNSLFISLIIPFEKQTVVSTGISTDSNGSRNLNAGVSRNFDETSSEYLRSASLNVASQSTPSGSATTAGTAFVSGQLGPVANISSMSWSNQGSRAVSTSFAASYGVTAEGVAFSKDGRSVLGGQVLGENNSAAITVLNHSEENQKIVVDGTTYEVPAKSTELVPRNPGYVKEIAVIPGPVFDPVEVKAGRYLEKGNVKAVLIADGFWAIETFQLATSAGKTVQLVPDYTYKRDGADIEKSFPDRKNRSLIYETRDSTEDIIRYIAVRNEKESYRCVSPAEEAKNNTGKNMAYRLLSFSCAVAPTAGVK